MSSGRYFEVWQRPEAVGYQVIDHLPLGDLLSPGRVPDCSQVRELGRRAGPTGRLAYAERPPVVVASLLDGNYPEEWPRAPVIPAEVLPTAAGTAEITARRAWSAYPGHFVPLAVIDLARGSHRVELTYRELTFPPGTGGSPPGLGPVVLAPADAELELGSIPAPEAKRLCGRYLDWIEAIR